MLVHTSQRTGEHATIAERLSELWNQCAFNSAKGLGELEELWKDDFAKVCAAQGEESYSEIVPGTNPSPFGSHKAY